MARKRLEKTDKVSHVVGSSKQKRNWKEYWMKKTGRKFPQKCQIYYCGNSAEVGAHVYVKRFHQKNFIMPTCQSCNMDPEQAYTGKSKNWVSAKQNAVVARVKPHANTFEKWWVTFEWKKQKWTWIWKKKQKIINYNHSSQNYIFYKLSVNFCNINIYDFSLTILSPPSEISVPT